MQQKCLALLCLCAALCGCASPTQRSDREAGDAGLSRSVVQGAAFRHLIYTRGDVGTAAQQQRLTVYLEGDGIPWIGGRIPATDPTTQNPLALRMMIRSSDPAIYVSRPCYHELRDDGCSAQVWTFARYSEQVVDSMTRAIQTKALALGAHDLKLVGYSGGGVLAVLIAERLKNVSEVVTIAANLDVDKWSAHHEYLPLTQSLNPARSTRAHPWKEVHLQGALDQTVPAGTTRAYFERFPSARQLTFERYDHVCCWLEEWSDVQKKVATASQ